MEYANLKQLHIAIDPNAHQLSLDLLLSFKVLFN